METSKNNWEPPKLDLSVDRHCAFKAWKESWDDYAIITKLEEQSAAYQCSVLRYTFTEDTRKIYNTLELTDAEKQNKTTILEKLEAFAKGTVNETMERHTFNSRIQEDGETFDDFVTELKILSKNCNFCATCHDGLLRDRIVAGIRDNALRQKLLSDSKLDLKKAEDACRALEKARQGAKMFNNKKDEKTDESSIDELTNRYGRNRIYDSGSSRGARGGRRGARRGTDRRALPSTDNRTPAPTTPNNPCRFCVKHHQYGRENCPAWGKKCSACGLQNHFQSSRICKRKTVRNLYEEEDEEEEGDVDFLFLSEIELVSSNAHNEVSDNGDEEEELENTSAESETENQTEENNDSKCQEPITSEDEEAFYSCNEGEAMIVNAETNPKPQPQKKKLKKRRRGPRKPKNNLKPATTDDDEAHLCPIANESNQKKESLSWEIHMPGRDGEIHFKIDTGADVTVIPDDELPILGLTTKDIRKTKKRLFGPGKKRLKCLGYVKAKFTWGDKTSEEIVYVCKGIKRALLGKPAIRSLQIVDLKIPKKYSCAEVEEQEMEKLLNTVLDEKTQEEERGNGDDQQCPNYEILKEFPQLYNRLGKIDVGGPINIKVKEGTIPHQTYSPRNIPLPQLKKVIEELKKMMKLGVIRKIDKPTEWCHPIVVVAKPNGDIRLCIDLTKLNAGVEREL